MQYTWVNRPRMRRGLVSINMRENLAYLYEKVSDPIAARMSPWPGLAAPAFDPGCALVAPGDAAVTLCAAF